MHLSIGRKLTAVIFVPTLLAAVLSIFSLFEIQHESQRSLALEELATASLRADDVTEAVQSIVIAADSVLLETDKDTARIRLDDLKVKLDALDRLTLAFLSSANSILSPERLTQTRLSIADFRSYQRDTAELGLTVSPQAAQLQANDTATIENRDLMVAALRDVKAELANRAADQRQLIATFRKQSAIFMIAVPAVTIPIALGFATWFVRSHIRRPFEALKRMMAGIASGNLHEHVTYTGRRDEFGEMAATLSIFRDAIVERRRTSLADAERAANDAKRAAQIFDVARAFEGHALSIMQDLTTSVTSMDGTANDVALTSQETLEKAGTVWQAAAEASTILASVLVAAKDLSASASLLSAKVEDSHAAAREALVEVECGHRETETLLEAASAIGGATGLIDAIARKTNMLALNATIEAARAGESGRGFAVVAGEVKLLAQQTAEATGQINARVLMIQEASAVTARVVRKAQLALDAVNDIAASIAVSSREQGQSSASIAESLASATRRARIVTESIGTVNEAAIVNGSRAAELKPRPRTMASKPRV